MPPNFLNLDEINLICFMRVRSFAKVGQQHLFMKIIDLLLLIFITNVWDDCYKIVRKCFWVLHNIIQKTWVHSWLKTEVKTDNGKFKEFQQHSKVSLKYDCCQRAKMPNWWKNLKVDWCLVLVVYNTNIYHAM